MSEQLSNRTIIELLRNNWFIVVFIATLIGTWVRFEGEIKLHEERLDKVEQSVEEASEKYTDLLVELGKIQTTLDFIKEKVTK